MRPAPGADDFLSTSACLRCRLFFLDPTLKSTHDENKHGGRASPNDDDPPRESGLPLVSDLRPAHSDQTFPRCNECDSLHYGRKQKYDHNRYVHSLTFKLDAPTTSATTTTTMTATKTTTSRRRSSVKTAAAVAVAAAAKRKKAHRAGKREGRTTREEKRSPPSFLKTHVCVPCRLYFRSRGERDVHAKARHDVAADAESPADDATRSFDDFSSLKPHRDASQLLQLTACLPCGVFFEDQPTKRRHVERRHRGEPGHWSAKAVVLTGDLKPGRTGGLHLECNECGVVVNNAKHKWAHNFKVHGYRARKGEGGGGGEEGATNKEDADDDDDGAVDEVVEDHEEGDVVVMLGDADESGVDAETGVEAATAPLPAAAAAAAASTPHPPPHPGPLPESFLQAQGCVRCYAFFASRKEKRLHLRDVHAETTTISTPEFVPGDLRFSSFAPASPEAGRFLLCRACLACRLYFRSRSARDRHVSEKEARHRGAGVVTATERLATSDLRPAVSSRHFLICHECDDER